MTAIIYDDLITAHATLRRIKQQRPIIHGLINQVTTPMVAMLMGAMGVKLSMSRHPLDAPYFMDKADGLIVNIGTPDDALSNLIPIASKISMNKNIPLIIDPVMINLSPYRQDLLHKFKHNGKFPPSQWRMNELEYQSLKGIISQGHEIDLAITGEEDKVVSQDESYIISSQNEADATPIIANFIGAGCLLSAFMAAFLAVRLQNESNSLMMAQSLYLYKIISKRAEKTLENSPKGPSSLFTQMIDLIYDDHMIV